MCPPARPYSAHGDRMISLLFMLVILGVVLYIIETKIPMDPVILIAIRVIVVICVAWWLLGLFGIADIPVPRLR